MSDVAWQGEYVDGDAHRCTIDADLSLDDLKKIVDALEQGHTIHWKPYHLKSDNKFPVINRRQDE